MKKTCMCFVDREKSFDRVPSTVLDWALSKTEDHKFLDRLVKRLYEGAKTSVRIDSDSSVESQVKVGMHQRSVPSPFLFAVAVDVVT